MNTLLQDGLPDLLPCPFCGGMAVMSYGRIEALNKWTHGVSCWNMNADCGAAITCFDAEIDAINAWNRRSPSAEETGE